MGYQYFLDLARFTIIFVMSFSADVALLTCQFYLRSISMFVLDRQLPDIGTPTGQVVMWFGLQHVVV